MRWLVSVDTNSLSYWLNWRALLCAIWIFSSILIALFLIWKYQLEDMERERSRDLHDDDTWRPCLKEIHPIWLLVFRIIAFCLLLVALVFDVAAHGAELFLYYTQWTFTLVTIYFAFGSLLSIHGCYKLQKITSKYSDRVGRDEERGLYARLTSRGNVNGAKSIADVYYQKEASDPEPASFWAHLFQVLFQMTASAVMLTDVVYWTVCYPFITIKDYEMSFLTVVAHSLNAILLIGDTSLNCLKFPWFRISYFLLWTSSYVIFQWIFHACVTIWWPYPFLDLSAPYAPLWYFLVGIMHIACYGIFAFLVKGKQYLFSRWFPQSYISS